MRNYVQGRFKPTNPQKYKGNVNNIIYRSYMEFKFMKWCDTHDNIIEYGSEEFFIPYFDTTTNRIRRYFPDFYLKIKNINNVIEKYVVEIKPHRQTIQPKVGKKKTKTFITESTQYEKNLCKWKAAKEFCEKNNLTFKIITEKDLNIKY